MTKSFKSLVAVAIISLLPAITQVSCSGDNDSDSECRDTICTLEFVIITVAIVDQNQNPVALDSFEVIDLETEDNITIPLTPSQFMEAQQSGRYPLITDGTLQVNQERQIQLRGRINNEEVINSNYTVGTDCCHIGLITGDLQLIVN